MATPNIRPQSITSEDSSPPRLQVVPEASGPNLLLPDDLTRSLWKSLLANLRERIFPERPEPLQITSEPVEVIMPVGEILSTPWYRTVFTNLGEVIAPETLPPLQLESRPVDVGELVSDRASRPWWSSLLRNVGDAVAPESLPPLQLESRPIAVGELLADQLRKPWWISLAHSLFDALAPEKLPPLQLTSPPVNPGLSSVGLQIAHWSALASTPVSLPRHDQPAEAPVLSRTIPKETAPTSVRIDLPRQSIIPKVAPVPLGAVQVDADSIFVLVSQFKDSLSRSRRREIFWVCTISVEILVLLAWYAGWI